MADSKSNRRTQNDADYGICEQILIFLSYLVFIIFFPIAVFFSIMIISEFERVIFLRLGRLRGGARGPGIVFALPCVDEVFRVDLRTDSFQVPAQDILTKDSVTIKVDAIIYYRINDPVKSTIEVLRPNEATELLAQTTLRNVAGTKMLVELLSSRDTLSHEILILMEKTTTAWGVHVERVEMKDIALPVQMQRALAQEAEAIREAKAKLIAANGEMEASINLKAASDIMKDSPITLQIPANIGYSWTRTKFDDHFPCTNRHLTSGFRLSKEIAMPIQLQRAMAAEQEAVRQAKAKIAAADGELQSATALRDASETMTKNPISLQLRYLQTLNTVSADKNHTIIVPFPLDVFRKFFGGSSGSSSKGENNTNPEKKTELEIKSSDKIQEMKSIQTDPIPDDFESEYHYIDASNSTQFAANQLNLNRIKKNTHIIDLEDFTNLYPFCPLNHSLSRLNSKDAVTQVNKENLIEYLQNL